MLGTLGLTEVLIVAGVVILLFGAKRIPIIGRSLGQGIHNLVQGVRGGSDEDPPALPPAGRGDDQHSS
jgi:sec-independent protein translocase protein TatA